MYFVGYGQERLTATAVLLWWRIPFSPTLLLCYCCAAAAVFLLGRVANVSDSGSRQRAVNIAAGIVFRRSANACKTPVAAELSLEEAQMKCVGCCSDRPCRGRIGSCYLTNPTFLARLLCFWIRILPKRWRQ